MLGHRKLAYLSGNITTESLPRLIEQGIAEQEKATALAGVMGLSEIRTGASKQAELVSALATKNKHELAGRLAEVHLRARAALSSDNNFLCQAAWMLAGGNSPVAEVLHPVDPKHGRILLDLPRPAFVECHVQINHEQISCLPPPDSLKECEISKNYGTRTDVCACASAGLSGER
jgi:hypothetical protein